MGTTSNPENVDAEQEALLALKAQMTDEQRQDMADMLKAELKRRETEKMKASLSKRSKVASSQLSNNIDVEAVGDMYSELDSDIRNLRVKKLENQLADARKRERRLGRPSSKKSSGGLAALKAKAGGMPSASSGAGFSMQNILLFAVILGLVTFKVLLSNGTLDASMFSKASSPSNAVATVVAPAPQAALPVGRTTPVEMAAANRRLVGWSAADKRLLTELDERRVELERRKAALDRREQQLESQKRALAERLAELRTLTGKLAELRQEKDHRYEARLEQLANVYGSMSPKEAAPLISKLDNVIALSLLERMPGKRMGQILSMMDSGRAIALTKSLTDVGAL